ncbi:hypothetical protein BDZ85DRAFT_285463 [Elsinoe ampelina]|uniref:Uncharacterized protein n=1 Tax=Elsinoe ampelina TaxID=302913 RepID=A0A6A6G183_9PEZI|nr:hypothetical protein BDZ85DRAFT_285463 [Elsinoe ampelina]
MDTVTAEHSYSYVKRGTPPPYRIDQTFAMNTPSSVMYAFQDYYDNWIEDLAIRLTNNIRQFNNVSGQSPSYGGVAYSTEQVFSVRWVWLILPVVLMLLSLILLAMTAYTTHDNGVEHWKNDALPLLHTSIDPEIPARARRPEDMAEEYVTLLRSTEDSSLVKAEAYESYPSRGTLAWRDMKEKVSLVFHW